MKYIKNINFSVLMSVYENDRVDYLKVALESTINQTLPPNEIVLVIDGPISEDMFKFIDEFKHKYDFLKAVFLPENKGLGNALREGMKHCSNEIIARMDSDDINKIDRFEKQMKYLKKYKNITIVGSCIIEFQNDIKNIIAKRIVPEKHEEIVKYLKKRCPFNHMSVMFKKSCVEKSGGYLDWHYNEDYYLWIRMYLNKEIFYNIQEPLIYVRVGQDTYKRRGGWKYFKSETELQYYMLKNKVIYFDCFILNVFLRMVIQIVMPADIRALFYRKLVRKYI